MEYYPAPIELALQKCQAYTRETGCEYMIALDRNYQIIMEKSGTCDQVEFSHLESIFLEDQGQYLIHSHPSDGSLSVSDLKFATSRKQEIWVITPNGFVARSHGFVNTPMNLTRAFHWVKARQARINLLFDCEAITANCSSLSSGEKVYPLLEAMSHQELIKAAQEGLIDYKYRETPAFQKNTEQFLEIERQYCVRNSMYRRLIGLDTHTAYLYHYDLIEFDSSGD